MSLAQGKPLIWLHGEVKSPPFSAVARIETGILLRRLQRGESLEMPHSRPMPIIGASCHELRIRDAGLNWRLIYFVDGDAVVILEVFPKKSRATPQTVIDTCQLRLKRYVQARGHRPS